MGLFDSLIGRSTVLRESAATLDAANKRIEGLIAQNDILRESYSGLESLRLEDYMWEPIQNWRRNEGLSLDSVRKEADLCRQLYAINPLIKKAVTARIGMIHGRGNRILLKGSGTTNDRLNKIIDDNHKKLFGPVARARLEAELSNAGNVWVMSDGSRPAIVIPFSQIVGYITDVEDTTKVLYWKRSYSTSTTDINTGKEQVFDITEYIPTNETGRSVQNIGDVPVRVTARMHHIAANRQEGWVLGLPDIFAAKFWTKGHKEMFEAGHEFTLAQGKIAAKITTNQSFGSAMTASRLIEEPSRDPLTGEVYGYGGTMIASNGLDYQLAGKMTGGVDFTTYDRIAGLVAAATGVPLPVILAESDSEEVSLEQTVIDDMKLRQSLWGEFYEDFFRSSFRVEVVWPRIKQDSLYRVQQALEISNRTNTLHAEERRLVTLEAYGLEGEAADLPDINDHPDVKVYLAKKQIDLQYAGLIAKATAEATEEMGETEQADMDRSTTPDQGNDAGIGKLSDGDDAHDARDAGEQEHTTS